MFPEGFASQIEQYPQLFQQKRGNTYGQETTVRTPKVFPGLKHLEGCEIREPEEIVGRTTRREDKNWYNMELINNLYNSDVYPEEFFADVDIVTTVSSLRSLICQWMQTERGAYYAKHPHFCQNFKGILYFHTNSDYSSPLDKSVNMIHKYRITGSNMSWSEFLREWNFGLAKLRLGNGVVIAYTYRFDAVHKNLPIDVKLKVKDDDFLFIGQLLTEKNDWIYKRISATNTSTFCATVRYTDLWTELTRDSRYILRKLFQIDLYEFFRDLKRESNNLEGVHSLSNVFEGFRLTRNYGKYPLICSNVTFS